jgi:hypothetical protein
LDNLVVPFYIQGDTCIGENGSYIGAYLAGYLLQAKIDMFSPNTWMTSAMSCGQMLIGMFDHYSKTGDFKVGNSSSTTGNSTTSSKLATSLPNMDIAKLVNNAQIPSVFGNNYTLNENGDLFMDLTVKILRHNPALPIFQPLDFVIVGNWSVATNSVTLNDNGFFFLGNRTSPPTAYVPPSYDYQPKFIMRVVLDSLILASSIVTLVLLGYTVYNRGEKVIKASSPLFLSIILIGVNVSFAGILILSIYPMV